ncbi:MAG: hypothetical protein JW950_03315 [Deltaproteobacteria bacterium]|nr:hypothetical protein [Deltaproteobacteria bacterium]
MRPLCNRNGRLSIALMSAVLSGILLFADVQSVSADRGRGGQMREFRDARHHHDRYYPARGQISRTLPRNHWVGVHGGARYYFSGGVWYRPSGARFVVSAPPIGLFVSFLPPYYTTIWAGGVPYYYANEVYYARRPGGYVVVVPPEGEVIQTQRSDQLFIYPRQGQSEQQQADDRYECHRWALGQTGYDPTRPLGGVPEAQWAQKRADYRRAMSACLDARGYTVK